MSKTRRPYPTRDELGEQFAAKFHASYQTGEGCWEWAQTKFANGYGAVCYGGRVLQAHRVSYVLEHGSVETSKFVCHKCDNPACVRPDHLFLGTQKQNMADMLTKGRGNVRHGEYSGSAKLNDGKVRFARIAHQCGMTYTRIGQIFGVSYKTIEQAVKRQRWAHVE